MSNDVSEYNCMTYCPIPYNGRGWPETCASLLKNFRSAGLAPTLAVPRATKPLPESVRVLESLSFPFSRLPWQLVGPHSQKALDLLFLRQIALADPVKTVTYFWPGSPLALVKESRRAGILTIRQMINTFQGTAKIVLDRAYGNLSLPSGCTISQDDVEREIDELGLYDYVFAPNPEVEQSLREAGVAVERIVPTSFGWSPARFRSPSGAPDAERPLRFLFVGMASVRKGVPGLLEAWKNARIAGELVFVGNVEAAIQDRMSAATREGSVRHVTFTDDVGTFYQSSDVFVFPTLEEGGPQVTLEAGGCGLPVITTAMGAARLVRHNVNGLIIEEENIDDLTQALLRMAGSAALRTEFSRQIKQDAAHFTYDKVSALHGRIMLELLLADGRGASRFPASKAQGA